jgi:hypothetical protein
VKTGPVLVPGKVFDWSVVYDPAANGGLGELRVALGKETRTLALKKGVKAEGAHFDRFGLCNLPIYLDDLKYTATRPAP